MLGGRGGAEVRLQRDVAEILEREHAEVVGMPEDRGIGTGICSSSRATFTNGSCSKSNGRRVQRQHERRCHAAQDAEVAAIRGVAGQRHDPRAAALQPAAAR